MFTGLNVHMYKMNLHPTRYYAGLSKTKKAKRFREIQKFGALESNDPHAYVGFKTDVGIKTKQSSYVKTLKKRFASLGIQGTQTLKQKAKISGVPYRLLDRRALETGTHRVPVSNFLGLKTVRRISIRHKVPD